MSFNVHYLANDLEASGVLSQWNKACRLCSWVDLFLYELSAHKTVFITYGGHSAPLVLRAVTCIENNPHPQRMWTGRRGDLISICVQCDSFRWRQKAKSTSSKPVFYLLKWLESWMQEYNMKYTQISNSKRICGMLRAIFHHRMEKIVMPDIEKNYQVYREFFLQ